MSRLLLASPAILAVMLASRALAGPPSHHWPGPGPGASRRLHGAPARADEDPVGRETFWRGVRSCELHGRAATLDLVVVSPPGEAPFRLAIKRVPATVHLAPPADSRAMHQASLFGALAFDAQAPGEWAHFVTAAPVAAADGLVRLSRGVRLTDVRGAAGGAVATVDLERSVRLPGLAVPCAALGLDEPGTPEGLEAPRESPTDGSFWVARGERLTVRARPGVGPGYTLEVEYPPALVFSRVRSLGRFALLDSWIDRAPFEVSGWVDEFEVEGYVPSLHGLPPPGLSPPAVEAVTVAPLGVYEGPVVVPAGTPIYAAAGGRGAWAAVRDERGLKVRWKPDERWVQVVSATGIDGLAGHAWMDRAAVKLPLAPGAWRVTGAPLGLRLAHTATLLRDGKVLVAGGWGAAARDADRRTPLASCELYDPDGASERFSATGSLNTPRAGHTATLLDDGRVLVVGGEWNPPSEQGIALASAEVFDPRSGGWSPVGGMSQGRMGHTATLLADGTVLIAGGEDGHGRSLESAEVWDPRDGRFHGAGHLGLRRYDHSATRLPSGKVLIAGGRHKNYALHDFWNSFAIDTVELYDPSSRAFEPAGELPAGGRTRHSATLVEGGRVLLAGGARQTDLDLAGIARSALLYEPAFGQWSRAGESGAREEEARGEHSATALPDGRVVIVSGPYALVYDGRSRNWQSAAGPTFERSGHTATLLRDGRLLVVGGEPPEDRPLPGRPGAELFLPPSLP